MSSRRGDRDAPEDAVDRILALDRAACLALWRETFAMVAPKQLSVAFMRRALAVGGSFWGRLAHILCIKIAQS